jgi:hypothetical protein
MLMLDVPKLPLQHSPIVLAQSGPAQPQPNERFDRTIGVCQLVRNPPSLPKMPGRIFATNEIVPDGDAGNYFLNLEGKKENDASARVSILKAPTHGQLQAVPQGAGVYYNYLPESGYLGTDSVDFKVVIGRMTVKVIYSIHVEDVVDDSNTSALCPKRYRKISGTPRSSNSGLAAYLKPSYTIAGLSVHLDALLLPGGELQLSALQSFRLSDSKP